MSSGSRFGRIAEWLALAVLLVKGYRILHRNWSGGGGELDLVVMRGGEVVFVEVKARRQAAFGGALSAMTAAKQRRLVRAACAYLSRFDLWDHPIRFDVVAIQGGGQWWSWRVLHIPNAFQPDLGRLG